MMRRKEEPHPDRIEQFTDVAWQMIAQQQVSFTPAPSDFSQTNFPLYSMLHDRISDDILLQSETTTVLRLAFDPLFRTTNVKDPLVRLIIMKCGEILAKLCSIFSETNEPAFLQLAKYFAYKIKYYGAICDADGGWRGKLATEQTKVIKFEEVEKQKKKLFGLF